MHKVDSKMETLEAHKHHYVCVYFSPHSLEATHSIASKMAPHESHLLTLFFKPMIKRNAFCSDPIKQISLQIRCQIKNVPDKYPVNPKNLPLRIESLDSSAEI